MAYIVYKALLHLCINKYLQGSDKEKSAVSASQQKYQWQQWPLCWSTLTVETCNIIKEPFIHSPLQNRPPSGIASQSIDDMVMRIWPIHNKVCISLFIVHERGRKNSQIQRWWQFYMLGRKDWHNLSFIIVPTVNVADIKIDKPRGTFLQMTR